MQPALNRVSEDEAPCFVCGKDCRETWFARIPQQERKICLCGPVCAMMYFNSPRPPSHDHQARHDYYRVRATVLGAARAVSAGERKQFAW